RKDVMQAGELIVALKEGGRIDALVNVMAEALDRGPAWRQAIANGAAKLTPESLEPIKDLVPGTIKKPK
ncbi:hypothetical protein, partial [Acinetobacter baumannii]|uniref:hypothetical protein n=1 Tax=Acinetobacter baumannii TaxID=470 RepID=UPI001C0A3F30